MTRPPANLKTVGDGRPIRRERMAEQKVILIVDDDYELSDGIRAVLETQGHKVLQARDGQQGQNLIYQQRPDLVILDMMMPRKGGYPVLEHFRDKKDAPPIIMITTNKNNQQIGRASCRERRKTKEAEK